MTEHVSLIVGGSSGVHAELPRPGLQRAVAGDLVVLHGLAGGDEAGVERVVALELVHDLLGFVDDSDDRVAGLAAGGAAHRFEDLVQSLDLAFGLVPVCLKRLLELGSRRFLRHLRQGPKNLLLGEIDVLQRLGEQLLEGIS